MMFEFEGIVAAEAFFGKINSAALYSPSDSTGARLPSFGNYTSGSSGTMPIYLAFVAESSEFSASE